MRECGENRSVSYDLALKGVHSDFHNISFITQASLIQYGKRLHKIIGAILEACSTPIMISNPEFPYLLQFGCE